MVGDYNYPLFRRGLGRTVGRTGHDLTFSDGRTYTRYKFLRGHFDFATSVDMTIQSIETLPKGGSDHLPILVSATYGAPTSIPVMSAPVNTTP
jgi:endonuclease/exonuclease/phosphatase (EEP) superfamily protein YafD